MSLPLACVNTHLPLFNGRHCGREQGSCVPHKYLVPAHTAVPPERMHPACGTHSMHATGKIFEDKISRRRGMQTICRKLFCCFTRVGTERFSQCILV